MYIYVDNMLITLSITLKISNTKCGRYKEILFLNNDQKIVILIFLSAIFWAVPKTPQPRTMFQNQTCHFP